MRVRMVAPRHQIETFPAPIDVRPRWQIRSRVGVGAGVGREGASPTRVSASGLDPSNGFQRIPIWIEPGVGWGTGAHATTQLCLQALAHYAPAAGSGPDPLPWRLLDFGAGSGILAIAAGRLGATVEAVEIDEAGSLHGRINVELNGLSDQIHYCRTLEGLPGAFSMVVANILKPVLMDFAESLATRIKLGGTLILSGLVSTDLPEISVRYGSFLSAARPEIFGLGEWRAAVWRNVRPNGWRAE